MKKTKKEYLYTSNLYDNSLDSTGCESNIPHYIGNGYCDDQNNNQGCLFDQGDCCLSPVNTDYCSDCSCAVEGVITSPGFPQFYDNSTQIKELKPCWAYLSRHLTNH